MSEKVRPAQTRCGKCGHSARFHVFVGTVPGKCLWEGCECKKWTEEKRR
jgi:hypothetical protein